MQHRQQLRKNVPGEIKLHVFRAAFRRHRPRSDAQRRMAISKQLKGRWQSPFFVYHHPQRMFACPVPHSQRRVVKQSSPRTHKYRVHFTPPFVNQHLCEERRQLRRTASCPVPVQETIRRFRPFQHHIRAFPRVEHGEPANQPAAFLLKHTCSHLYSRIAKHADSTACHQ